MSAEELVINEDMFSDEELTMELKTNLSTHLNTKSLRSM